MKNSHCLAKSAIAAALLASCAPAHVAPARLDFDFGSPAFVEPGTLAIGAQAAFTPEAGYGWLNAASLLERERLGPDALRRDFVFGSQPATFRFAGLKPGLYKLSVVCGDVDFGNHVTRLKVAGAAVNWPLLAPAQGEFLTFSATVKVDAGTLDVAFDSPQHNWIVNAMSLEPTAAAQAPAVASQVLAPVSWPSFPNDPTKPLLAAFRLAPAPRGFAPTGLARADYLKLIAGEVDFWKAHQNADGAIIDPYRKQEFQYSTPAFAHAAAALVAWGKRDDLLEAAAKAMDWAVKSLSERKAASGHEDFYAPMLAHALPLLKPRVVPARAARWEAQIKSFEPSQTYRSGPGANNWNMVALAGESLFEKMGLRDAKSRFVQSSLAAQGRHFGSPYGLYLEGPMPYDHFPRLWAGDMLAHGYSGPYKNELDEALRRAALTSLWMQSPWGELPAGGRSAHHQWNEAEQCVTYEIYGARALREGDAALASTYKRAAHLALASMRRWVRPSGEMQIVKNWVDPAQAHAFEGYSAHSQYNLLPMSMLAIAYEHAASTEAVEERPAPADVGGFAFEIEPLHKIFANAGGTYVEIDTAADHHYDATGLIRVHVRGLSPQLGPSDSLVQSPAYRVPGDKSARITSGIGVSWRGADGGWHRLGELGAAEIVKRELSNVQATPQRVAFNVTYEGKLNGPTRIIESYVLTPGRVELSTRLEGYEGPLRMEWPVLADDGRTPSVITGAGRTVTVSQDGGQTAQSFEAPGAQSVRVGEARYANHNGWARLATAEFAHGPTMLVIAPRMR